MQLLSQGLIAPTPRTIPDFDLCRPLTVAGAVAAAAGAEGAVYAQGCTDLFARFREGLACRTLVSLDRIPGLREISLDGGTLRIGAGAVHHEGARHPAVVAALPGLAAAWRRIATERIRRRATIGGNIMARRGPGGTSPGGTARDGTVRMSVGSEMRRHVTVEAPLGTDPMAIAALLPDEIGDPVAGASYRRHVAGVLLGRLLSGRLPSAPRTAEESR